MAALSEVCIGIPMDLLFAVLGDGSGSAVDPAVAAFVLPALSLPWPLVNALVRLVRATDTPDAYFMDKAFARGALVDATRHWTVKPAFAAALAACVAEHGDAGAKRGETLTVARKFALSLHYKRARGALANPATPQHDIVFVWGRGEGHWFDATASDAPARRREHEATPTRRAGAFALENPKDARWPHACRGCNNRFTHRLQTCGKCFVARYCDRSCQSKDWKAHKDEECSTYRELKTTLRAAAAAAEQGAAASSEA